MTYKVTFFRRMTGERGDVSDVQFHPPIRAAGLTYDDAVSLKTELESWPVVATEFFVVEEEPAASEGRA